MVILFQFCTLFQHVKHFPHLNKIILNQVILLQVRLLGAGLVRVEESKSTDGTEVVIKPITLLPNIIELSYYASALSPVFALDAIVGK